MYFCSMGNRNVISSIINYLEFVWIAWKLSDITQFTWSIIQNKWVPQMDDCLAWFWMIVSITQFSDFWVMSYENWKHILGVFSFHNSIFNGIFIIKTTYWVPWSESAVTFDPLFFFFIGFGEFGFFIFFFFFFLSH